MRGIPEQVVVTYDENTLFKVFDALRKAGLDEKQARDCISDMQNEGILFRERKARQYTTRDNPRAGTELLYNTRNTSINGENT